MNSRYKVLTFPVAVVMLLISTVAAAHHPMGGDTPTTYLQGFLSGLGHPIIGIDHFAFIVGVGIILALGVARPVATPVAMLAAAAAGTVLNWFGASLPFIETIVALTVIGIAAAVVYKPQGRNLVTWVAGAAAFCHGQAYGGAVIGAESTPLITYLLGFTLIQVAIASTAYFVTRKVATRSAKQLQLLTAGSGTVLGGLGVVFAALSVGI